MKIDNIEPYEGRLFVYQFVLSSLKKEDGQDYEFEGICTYIQWYYFSKKLGRIQKIDLRSYPELYLLFMLSVLRLNSFVSRCGNDVLELKKHLKETGNVGSNYLFSIGYVGCNNRAIIVEKAIEMYNQKQAIENIKILGNAGEQPN